MKSKKEIKARLALYMQKQKEITNPNQVNDGSHEFASYVLLDAQLRILINELQWVLSSTEDELSLRSDKIKRMDAYTKFLQKKGYIDTDATCEEPFAIDEFLKEDK